MIVLYVWIFWLNLETLSGNKKGSICQLNPTSISKSLRNKPVSSLWVRKFVRVSTGCQVNGMEWSGRPKSGVKRSSGALKIYCARRIAYHAPNKGLLHSPLVWPTESACSDSEGECDKRSRSRRRALPGEKREKRELLAMGIGLHDSSTVADTA